MKRIINPWRGMEGYRCYGCDPHSPEGLRMEFYEDGEEIVSLWHPRPEFQGRVDTLHGGIQATLADEISSWVVFRKFQTSGVTTRMEVRYHRPIHTSDDHIVLRARVEEQRRNLVRIAVRITDSQERLCPRPPASTSSSRKRRPARSSTSATARPKRATSTRCPPPGIRKPPGNSPRPTPLPGVPTFRAALYSYTPAPGDPGLHYTSAHPPPGLTVTRPHRCRIGGRMPEGSGRRVPAPGASTKKPDLPRNGKIRFFQSSGRESR